jgi:hypothetical protein
MASALVGVSPAGAQEEPETLGPVAVNPTSGPSGTVISVSGEGCDGDASGFEAWLTLVAYDPDHGVPFTVLDESVVVPENGDWSGELTVPDGADPDVDTYVLAECTYDEGEGYLGEYDSVPFDVTGETTATTATTAPEAPQAPAPVAPVATPVVRQPSFTG